VYRPSCEQRVRLPLDIAVREYPNPRFAEWASNWISEADVTPASVRSALTRVQRDERAPAYVVSVLLAALHLAEAYASAAAATHTLAELHGADVRRAASSLLLSLSGV
jgi:hypothetical protein